MKKQKGMIITAAVLLAAAAVVTGSRLIRHPEKSNTKKSEVADQENSEKEQDHRTSGTELSEKKQNMNEPDHTQKEQSVENADRTGKSITEEAFYISKIPDDIFEKMQGKSYKADCTVPREDLRYLHVLHMGFDGQTKEGELVVNKAIAEDVLAIFRQLYEAEYPIEKVRLVDEYDADDEASMSDNNSSAFNFRFISHTTKISKHGLGMAVDINTSLQTQKHMLTGVGIFRTRLITMICVTSFLPDMDLPGVGTGHIRRIISILKKTDGKLWGHIEKKM